MALHADEGTYVAHEWKDQPDDYTPITPEKLNHIEQGIQDNSEDIKALGDSVSRALLYDSNDTASFSAITLSDDVSNYSMIEIQHSASGVLKTSAGVREAIISTFAPVVDGGIIAKACSITPATDQNSLTVRSRVWSAKGRTLSYGDKSQSIVRASGFDKYSSDTMPVYRVYGWK